MPSGLVSSDEDNERLAYAEVVALNSGRVVVVAALPALRLRGALGAGVATLALSLRGLGGAGPRRILFNESEVLRLWGSPVSLDDLAVRSFWLLVHGTKSGWVPGELDVLVLVVDKVLENETLNRLVKMIRVRRLGIPQSVLAPHLARNRVQETANVLEFREWRKVGEPLLDAPRQNSTAAVMQRRWICHDCMLAEGLP